MINPDNILIIRPDRLGDLILSLPVAETLKKRFPAANISYLAASGPSLIKPFVPYVDGWLVDSNENLGRGRLAQMIKPFRFDCAVELKPSLRTATSSFLAGIKIRIGTSRRVYSLFYNRRVDVHRKGSGKHQTDLDLELLAPLGISVNGLLPRLEMTDGASAKGKTLVGAGAKRYIVIHPGSGGSAPNWPLEYYKKLAVMILETGDWGIVITGNDDPVGKFDEHCIDLNGKTDIEGLAGVLNGSKVFISGSTGPLHLADSLGVRCMSFFIRHDVVGPDRWGPSRNMNNVITPDNQCKCANLNRCSCLQRISPETAMSRLKAILANEAL